MNAKFVACLLAATMLAGCGEKSEPPKEMAQAEASAPSSFPGVATSAQPESTASGLKYIDLVVGSGAVAEAGKAVVVHYTGYLTNGMKVDSSVDRDQAYPFRLGQAEVIKGWDEGIAGMKVGGKRKLIIPPQLGYGERGAGGVIPPNAELIFDIELLDVK